MNQRELIQYATDLNPEADVILVTTCGAIVNVLPLYEYTGTDDELEALAVKHTLFVANNAYYGGEATSTTIDLRGRRAGDIPSPQLVASI